MGLNFPTQYQFYCNWNIDPMNQGNDEYAISERTHTYRRRSFSDRDERKNHSSRHRHHHSPPPPHTHHQPVMKFNADFWKQVGKQGES